MKKANKALNIVSACLSTLIVAFTIIGIGVVMAPKHKVEFAATSLSNVALIILCAVIILLILSGIANAIVTSLTKPQDLGLNKTASIVFHSVCGGFIGLMAILIVVAAVAKIDDVTEMMAILGLVLIFTTCCVYSTFSIYSAVKQKI